MSLTNKEKKTINYYDQSVREWISTHGGENDSFWLAELQKFHLLLPSGKVLEIGSGSGKDAKVLIQMGYEYTGTDASKGLIETARERNPGARFEKKNLFNLDYRRSCFDGFWSAATLLHVPKNRIDIALRSIKRVVKQSGVGFISLKQGEGEKEEIKTGRWFAYYNQDEFAEILARNSFRICRSEIRQDKEDTWLIYYVFNG